MPFEALFYAQAVFDTDFKQICYKSDLLYNMDFISGNLKFILSFFLVFFLHLKRGSGKTCQKCISSVSKLFVTAKMGVFPFATMFSPLHQWHMQINKQVKLHFEPKMLGGKKFLWSEFTCSFFSVFQFQV